MKVTCDYCGVMYDDNLTNCPNCGSPNNKIDRTSNAQPKTIPELQEWFRANGYDYYKTRFFIGIDYKDPKAFGIYKD
nr:anaerobic ribonucleoside-triphosphate reductase [Lachnospiraceae bacterium]